MSATLSAIMEDTKHRPKALIIVYFSLIVMGELLVSQEWLDRTVVYQALGLTLMIAALTVPGFKLIALNQWFDRFLLTFCVYAAATSVLASQPSFVFLKASAIWLVWRLVDTVYPASQSPQQSFWLSLSLVVFAYSSFITFALFDQAYLFMAFDRLSILNGLGHTDYLGVQLLAGFMLTLIALTRLPSVHQFWLLPLHALTAFLLLASMNRASISAVVLTYGLLGFHFIMTSDYGRVAGLSKIIVKSLAAFVFLIVLSVGSYWLYGYYHDATLWFHVDGRPFFWQHLINQWLQTPFWYLGIGFGEQAKLVMHYKALATSHNVYLDVLITTGIPGLLAFGATLGVAVVNAARWEGLQRTPTSVVMMTCHLVLLWHGLFESYLIQQLSGLLFVLMLCQAHRSQSLAESPRLHSGQSSK